MIELYNDYFIDVDSLNYSLCKLRVVKGKEVKVAISHHGTLMQALKAFGEENIRNKLSSAPYSLKNAVDTIAEENRRLEDFIDKSFAGIDLNVPRWKQK